MGKERMNRLKEFQEILGVDFNKVELLNVALTHSSYANQFNLTYNDHNERLEFLGDSILSMVTSEYIYKKYKNKPEGKLTRIRAGVVCEASLAEISRRLLINKYIRIGKGEELSGGREKDSLLADACEAVIAAIYLDSGLEKAREFIVGNLSKKIDLISNNYNYRDYKSKLQEYVQRSLLAVIKYTVANESGPPHDKTFEIEVYLDNKCYGKGTGKSKKEAEQNAAKEALKSLGVELNE
jgi:ribonuclease III